MILSYTKNAVNRYAHIDIQTLEVVHLDVPLTDARLDPISPIDDTSFLVVGSGNTLQQGVYHVSLDAGLRATTTLLDPAASKSYPAGTFSEPEVVELVSKRAPKRPIHGFYWPPHNPGYAAPEGTLPPLLVHPHGGPTAHSGPGLKIGSGAGGLGNAAFWTSRGFGYFVLNYTGSSGHGRAYRQRLQSQWGVLDRDDVPECVDYLCSATTTTTTTGTKGPPRADRRRVGIHGASAGGYNVLQGLVWHPGVFAAGVSYCGVSDVQALAEGTHKLESHYLFGLLYPGRQGQGDDEPDEAEKQRAAISHARSPLFHAHRIAAPLLLCHGDRDTVVPIAQSYEVAERIKKQGATEVKMVVAEGEGHMFRMRASQALALENEVAWFLKTLVRQTG